MKTDKQIYLLLGTGTDAFRLLTGGIELPGSYRGRSVVLKELERWADHVFEPESGEGPAYIIEIQAQRGGDVYDRLVLELVLYRKAHPGRTVYGLVIFLDADCDEPDSPWTGSLGTDSCCGRCIWTRCWQKRGNGNRSIPCWRCSAVAGQ